MRAFDTGPDGDEAVEGDVRRSSGRPHDVGRAGGAGFVVAGLLQMIGGLPFALGAAPDRSVSAWQLLAWPVGGVVLLATGILLGIEVRERAALVGPAVLPRVALIAVGAAPLLLTIVAAVAWSATGSTQVLLALVQLVGAGGAAIVAATLLRRVLRADVVGWGFVAIAAVDAVALVPALVPHGTPAFQFLVAFARPLAVAVTGALILLRRPPS